MVTTAENLGPADRIINTILSFTDHMVHNRPGVVVSNPHTVTGVSWFPAFWKQEGAVKVIYRKDKVGRKTVNNRLGVLLDNGKVDGTPYTYRPAGLQAEVAVYIYKQIAEVWKLDNEFAARWASYVYLNDTNKDRKVLMAAFMLVQNRKGDPVVENGKTVFCDEDYRSVGEAMVLLTGSNFLDLKLILRIRDVLRLPEISKINRDLGFGVSDKKPFMGRYNKVAQAWLKYREDNIPLLEGLVKKGFSRSLKDLARSVQYKPQTNHFFKTLRWKQTQSLKGHRTLSIGEAVTSAETWEGLSEAQICKKIIKDKPDFKRIVGLLPAVTGLTKAVMAAAIEAGSLSNKDLVIQIPTIEALGLHTDTSVKARIDKALQEATDQRSANIALRVKSADLKKSLVETSENVVKKEVAKVLKNLVIFVVVDISGSMHASIKVALEILPKLVTAFPLDKIHCSVFNTVSRKIKIKHESSVGVAQAFAGVTASGGTNYGAGVSAFKDVSLNEGEEALFLFIGDEGQLITFEVFFDQLSFKPVSFGLIKLQGDNGLAVQNTAKKLSIPCFKLDTKTFEDTYALPSTLRSLIENTPVGVSDKTPARVSMVDTILKTELLAKPLWAA